MTIKKIICSVLGYCEECIHYDSINVTCREDACDFTDFGQALIESDKSEVSNE